jgi:hypothetical protein
MTEDNLKPQTATDANTVLADSKNGIAPKLFELGWGWYEDWSYHLFIHFDKTQEDFKEDVKSLLIKYGKDIYRHFDFLELKSTATRTACILLNICHGYPVVP